MGIEAFSSSLHNSYDCVPSLVLTTVVFSPLPFRFPSIPQPHAAIGAPRGGPSALFPSHLTREWQCPCYQLQGVSEPHLCGGQDSPARGEVWGLQWSYGRLVSRGICRPRCKARWLLQVTLCQLKGIEDTICWSEWWLQNQRYLFYILRP